MADSGEIQPTEPVDTGEKQQSEPVCNFFRKPTKNKNIRKRTHDEDENEDSKTGTSVLHQQKKPPKPDNKLYFSTGSSRKSTMDEPNKESEPIFQFESSKEIQVQHDSRATATLETETDFSRDARAIRERVLKQSQDALKGKNKSDEKLYKGIHGYTDYKAGFRREQTVASEKAGGAHGPLRASAHIRASARFDYQPDIWWQMEKEWEEAEKARKRNLAMGGDDADEGGGGQSDEDDDDALPFACFICRQPFVDPVVTKCKHFFCEHCALRGLSHPLVSNIRAFSVIYSCFLFFALPYLPLTGWPGVETSTIENDLIIFEMEPSSGQSSSQARFPDDILNSCCLIITLHKFLPDLSLIQLNPFGPQHHSKNKKCFVCNQPTLGMFNTAHEIRKKMAAERK
ncbi:Zinc finger CCCH domain-containing protein 1 [Vitis vinifera]|uniref:Zinc finger CCCH domain-containing protein 1 n=1 Tax=Vitis vinifera TaxID=29760 RepID=A0A438JM72_VITVI|nr:Zinc finger CCCH domain-containing protein 1 [Vitis vinifera]